MLRSQFRKQGQTAARSTAESRTLRLVVFSVAGQRLARQNRGDRQGDALARRDRFQSETRFVTSLVRHEDRCLPVFDLAAKFQRTMRTRICVWS